MVPKQLDGESLPLIGAVKDERGYVLLRHDDAQLVLDPEHGGAVREYRCLGRHILRPAPDPSVSDPFALASFPLVPYANRIAHGRFSSGAHQVQLRPNWAADPHPIHGQGWRAHWQIVHACATEATLQFEGGADEWPWHYRAEQHFRISATALTIRLAIENLSSAPMPAMLGLHPYFPDPVRAVLQAHTPRVWNADSAYLPVDEVDTPASWSFERGRRVSALPLDHCFSGWNGTALLRWPDRAVTLQSRNCSHLHVYVPADGEFFCLEPQTAATGALNRGSEARLLRPGERFTMQMDLHVGVP